MDPNACLEAMRTTTAHLLQLHRQEPTEEQELAIVSASARLAELVSALDGWLSAGGFIPAQWAKWL